MPKESAALLTKGVRDVAIFLAKMHVQSAPEIKEIYLFPSGPDREEIRLIEIDPTTTPSEEITPYYFNPDPANGGRTVTGWSGELRGCLFTTSVVYRRLNPRANPYALTDVRSSNRNAHLQRGKGSTARALSLTDPRTYAAGFYGADERGLYRPEPRGRPSGA